MLRLRNTIKKKRNRARAPIHPGEHLAEELKELQMSAAELSRQLKVPTNRITSILNWQRAITGDTALRLAHVFGTSAPFLAEPAGALRTASRRAEGREGPQGPPESQARQERGRASRGALTTTTERTRRSVRILRPHERCYWEQTRRTRGLGVCERCPRDGESGQFPCASETALPSSGRTSVFVIART